MKEQLKKIKILKNFCKTIRFHHELYSSRKILRKQIKTLCHDSLTQHLCPVCESTNSTQVNLVFEEKLICKFFCQHCQHFYSNWLDSDLEEAQNLFDYKKETLRKYEQKYLLQKVIRFSRQTRGGYFLDFGVGGNINASVEMQQELPANIFYACDINKRKEERYFVTYADDNMLGIFDGIVSNSVVEHLDDTIKTWLYFNKLLKPAADGGGVMIHSFPSQLHFDWSHWGLKIKNHVCLFSKVSLEITCQKNGFEFLKWKYYPELRWPVLYFKKIRDA